VVVGGKENDVMCQQFQRVPPFNRKSSMYVYSFIVKTKSTIDKKKNYAIWIFEMQVAAEAQFRMSELCSIKMIGRKTSKNR
jgi:hypothetical protein